MKLNSKAELVCPLDSENWPVFESIEKLKPNWSVMEYLDSIELLCVNHPSTSADFFDKSTLSPLCEQCAEESPKLNLFDCENDSLSITSWLQDEIKPLATSPSLPVEMKNQIKMSAKNSEKVAILRKLRNFINKLFCDKHPDTEADVYNISKAECLCANCAGSEDMVKIKINSENFTETIAKNITIACRFSELSMVPEAFRKDTEELKAMPLKELVAFHKSFMGLNLSQTAILSSQKCPKCKNLYSTTNMPYVLSCAGLHCICKNCVDSSKTVVCPLDGSENAKAGVVELFDYTNSMPKCSECKNNFDLKFKVPKEFACCGYVVCLECLERNYILKKSKNCKVCQKASANMLSFANSKFFTDLILRGAIYCSVHRNRFAQRIVLNSLNTLCEQCCKEMGDEKISLFDEAHFAYNLLCEQFSKRILESEEFQKNVAMSIDEFSKLSNQMKIDKIREGINPEKKDNLRSNLPEGIRVLEATTVNDYAFLFRFCSTMPSENYDQNNIFVTKPWVIDIERNQIEAVVFKCNTNIILYGIGLGQALNRTETYIELLEIRAGKSLVEGPAYYKESQQYAFDHKFLIQDIIFSSPVEIKSEVFFNLKIKIKGEMLRRGNPFDLKEVQAGSDGSIFEFAEPENIGDFFVNGQHDINGPILKFIYQRA